MAVALAERVEQAQSPVSQHVTLNTGKRNFDALTGLRFFAAIGVVLFHFASTLDKGWWSPAAHLIDSSSVAVSFFYVLSGFVLSYSFVSAEGKLQGTRRSFWVARLARIYPAYLLAFLLAAPTNIAWTLRVNEFGRGVFKLLSGAISVLTLQQAWTPWSAWYWNYPGWSVSVEAFFYLVFPFFAVFLYRFRRGRSCLWAMAALWVIGLIAPILLLLTRGPATGLTDRFYMAVEFTPLLRLPEFLLGMLLGRMYLIGYRLSPRAAAWLSYISLAGVVGALMASPSIPRPLLSNGLLAPLFALLILSLAERQGFLARCLSITPLVILGEASYGIYILQIPVAYVLRMPPPMKTIPELGMYLLILVLVSLLSWRFVESPLRVQIRRWLSSNGSRPSPPRSAFVPGRPQLHVTADGHS